MHIFNLSYLVYYSFSLFSILLEPISSFTATHTGTKPASVVQRIFVLTTTTATTTTTTATTPLSAAATTQSGFLCQLSTKRTFLQSTNSNTNNSVTNNTIMNTRPSPAKDPEEEPQLQSKVAVLRIYGPDKKGIVAAFTQLLYGHGCNIIHAEQFGDDSANLFFQRIVFDYSTMHTDRITIEYSIKEVCERFDMINYLNWNEKKKKIAIMVSKYDHCLWELLLRHRAGELDCDIGLIISNHEDLRHVADTFGIPYHVYKVTKPTKELVEKDELTLLKDNEIDLVILARYMQIISDHFCMEFQHKVINIHHSFLPAFIGGKPYHRAHQRGVKLIGATAHYATAELDEGPIIEQDITRISHKNSVNDLIRNGRLLEKNVLVTAVKAHLEDRIIVYNNKCVVFD